MELTKKRLIKKIYQSQKQSASKKSYALPSYSEEELFIWADRQNIFHKLFENWKLSGMDTNLIPSIDRKDDYKSYTIKNIQLMTWEENRTKSYKDVMSGKNNKQNKSVDQYDKNGIFIETYHSLRHAERKTGVQNSHISKACRGQRALAGNFKWRYSNV